MRITGVIRSGWQPGGLFMPPDVLIEWANTKGHKVNELPAGQIEVLVESADEYELGPDRMVRLKDTVKEP